MFDKSELIELRKKRDAVDYNGQEENDNYVAELDKQIEELTPCVLYVERLDDFQRRYTRICERINDAINRMYDWNIAIDKHGVRYDDLPTEHVLEIDNGYREIYEREIYYHERNLDLEGFKGGLWESYRERIIKHIARAKRLLEEYNNLLDRIKYVSGDVKFEDYDIVVKTEGVKDENSDKVKYLEIRDTHMIALIILPEEYKCEYKNGRTYRLNYGYKPT